MDIIFFYKNLNYVKRYLSQNTDSVAFWYNEGLLTYEQLDQIVRIDRVLIEDIIYDSFLIDYPNLFKFEKIEKFPTVTIDYSSTKKNTTPRKICFFASNDTHVYLFTKILEKYKLWEFDLYCEVGENAHVAAERFGIQVKGDSQKCIKNADEYSLLVIANDWGLLERNLSNSFIAKGINSLGMQESMLDLNPLDNRLRNCSLPIFQGLNSLNGLLLNGLICAIIGNPRFENLKPKDLLPNRKIFINVNFTYGVFEKIRQKWIEDILAVSADLNSDYIISQHPRDNGDLNGLKVLKSHAGIVHETIQESRVVISRFSALILEAVCLGRPAIYYNPHGEEMGCNLSPDNKMLFDVRNTADLKQTLSYIFSDSFNSTDDQKLLNFHLGITGNKKASFFIFQFINCVTDYPLLKKISLSERMFVKAKIFKRKLFSMHK